MTGKQHPDDLVFVEVICMRGGECWSWQMRRAAAEDAMAATRRRLPDAEFRVRTLLSSAERARLGLSGVSQ